MKLSEIAEHLQCAIPSDTGDNEILQISSLENADEGSITFLSDNKLKETAHSCKASVIIVKKGEPIVGKINLEVEDPYLAYAYVAQLFEDISPEFNNGINLNAIVDSSSDIHATVSVGPGSVIGKKCTIGENTVIDANCVLESNVKIGTGCRINSGVIIRRDCVIGNRVIIQSGTVIGSEGFGNALDGKTFVRIPCFGNGDIEDDVEIGANVTVDRGNFKSTIIRKGARIDNLVQIAHNVEVGENTAMAAQVGISGSVKVGNNVLLAGQAGFVGHIEIGDGAFVGAKAGVSKSVAPGEKVTGYPARDIMKTRRIEAAQQYLPEMHKELKRLRKEIETLKNK
jgi:UDP-3-O-[3-hydroxymyristoyl] glucosamine N-acyltransferase